MAALAVLPAHAKEGPPISVGANGVTINALLPEPPDDSWIMPPTSFTDDFFSGFSVSKAASGFQYKFLKEGSGGAKPAQGQEVQVNYKGFLLDGTLVDTSFVREKPLKITVGSPKIISGWTAVLTGMTAGMRVIVRIPAEFAYGEQGRGKIPPNSPLVYYMELVQ